MLFSFLETVGLSKDLLEEGEISAKEIALGADTTVFKSGDPCGAFLIITSGQLRVEITTKSGRDLLLYRMYQSDTCIITTSVLLNHESYYAQAVTETPVNAIAIPANDFHKALKLSHTFSQYILKGYAHRISALLTLLDKIASKDITYELSYLLLKHADSTQTIHLTQKEIAREVGTAREVISRKLSILNEQGVVKVQRGKIVILDKTYLHEVTSI